MVLNRRDALGAAANAALVAGVAIIGNGLLRVFGVDQGGDAALEQPAFAPPGWVIGAIWVGLFALMGLSRWRVATRSGGGRAPERALWALIALCFFYPYYTLSFSVWPAFLGALLALAASVWVALKLRPVDGPAAWLLAPLVAWTAFAVLLTAAKLAIN